MKTEKSEKLIGHTELACTEQSRSVEVQPRFMKTFSFKNNSYESI